VLARYHRMRGFCTLWQPGIDHAGIATQTVVERQLLKENKTRHDLGREAFVKRVWQWKAESGGQISKQQRVLGVSADWPRSKFTMDEDMSRAVTEAFVRLHDEGLLYRATRLINWDPAMQTSLSDLEVDHEETNGELFEFAYPIEGGGEIVMATTRPETMLGDTGIAIHPDDPRHAHLHGKFALHPFVDRRIPIILDAELVDMTFGTGAVKLTPAHDFNDFAAGKRHGLEEISIFDLAGRMNDAAGPFKGMDRKEARRAVKKKLDEKGLARGSKPHKLMVPKSQRSGEIVEPMISTQWFLKMKGMADDAIAAVRTKQTVIIPEEWEKTYFHFLENIQDWCVSRQLWWGHQIPAWHGPNGEIKVARERPAECGEGWTQDPDVLDTWFSSALWPFSTIGWPNETNALKKFYPASDLETGYDILFFWVARMMMFGIHLMGKPPFSRVLLHGLVVDETGEKMSKVKGNVIDPLWLIHGVTFADVLTPDDLGKFKKAYPSAAAMGAGFPTFGADAVRFTLSTYPPSAKRIALAPKRIEGHRHFLNKIWNATRLSLELLGDFKLPDRAPPKPKNAINRWLLSRLGRTAEICWAGIDAFRVDEASNELYRFFWYDFCDWYLELAKTIIREDTPDAAETRATLAYVLDASLRLLHPVIPFLTEELWQRIPRAYAAEKSIALAGYPSKDENPKDESAEREMADLQLHVSGPRKVRTEYRVPFSQALSVRYADTPRTREILEKHRWAIEVLVKTSDIELGDPPDGYNKSVIADDTSTLQFGVGLKGIIDPVKEQDRITKELGRNEKELAAVRKTLGSPGFLERAPKEAIDQKHADLKRLEEEREQLMASLAFVKKLKS
jgi:valyl-tRNA synthetase